MIYRSVVHLINEYIDASDRQEGDALPAEKTLAAYFKVSRNTLRKALAVLEQEGIIEKRQGTGSIIRHKKTVAWLNGFMGFSEIARIQGKPAVSRVLSFEVIPARENIAAWLQCEVGEPVFHVKRLRTMDKTPMQLEETWLSAQRFPRLTMEHMNHSKFDFFEEECGITIAGCYETFSTALAHRDVARMLNLSEKDPVIRIEMQAVEPSGRPLDYSVLYNNNDEFRVRYFYPRVR